jgi:hypothetical protein
MNESERTIAAVFSDRDQAASVFDLLKADGFLNVWMAVTKPAAERSREPEAKPDSPLDTPPHNDVAESSDGVLGTIGRFFTGEGNSLRRSLEDHGVDPLDAIEIDERLTPLGAVITVIPDGRGGRAAETLERGGGRIGGPRTSASPANLAVREPDHPAVLVPPVGAREETFYERRAFKPATARTTPAVDERRGLDDLM